MSLVKGLGTGTGTLAFRDRGIYDATVTDYRKGDLVSNNSGKGYVARKNVPVNTPLSSAEFWLDFSASVTRVVGQKGEKGDTGNSITVMYRRATSLSNRPSGGSYNGTTFTPPANWSTTVPLGDDRLYIVIVLLDNNNNTVSYSQPIGIEGLKGDKGDDGEDGKNIEVQFSPNGTNSWTSASTTNTQYIRIRLEGNSTWNVIKIKGDKGDKGEDGEGGGTDDQNASEVRVDTSSFTRHLSATDNNVQAALQTIDAFIFDSSGSSTPGPKGEPGDSIFIQFSPDDSAGSYRDTAQPTDEYIRFRMGSTGTWLAGIQIKGDPGRVGPMGMQGEDGKDIEFEFSPNGTDTWTTNAVSTTKYIRFRLMGQTAWRGPVKFVGDKGEKGDPGEAGRDRIGSGGISYEEVDAVTGTTNQYDITGNHAIVAVVEDLEYDIGFFTERIPETGHKDFGADTYNPAQGLDNRSISIRVSRVQGQTNRYQIELVDRGDNEAIGSIEAVYQSGVAGSGGGGGPSTADQVSVVTDTFDSWLGPEDDNVQKALEDLDDLEAHFEFAYIPENTYYRYSAAATNLGGDRIDIWYIQTNTEPPVTSGNIDNDYLTDLVSSGWTLTRPTDSKDTKTWFLAAYDENGASPAVAADSLPLTLITELLPKEMISVYYASSGTTAPTEGTTTANIPSAWTTTPGDAFTVQTVFDPAIVASLTETLQHNAFRVAIGKKTTEWLHLPFLISEIDAEIEKFLDALIGDETATLTGINIPYAYSVTRSPDAVPRANVQFGTRNSPNTPSSIASTIFSHSFSTSETAAIAGGEKITFAFRVINNLNTIEGSQPRITLTVQAGTTETFEINPDVNVPYFFTIPNQDNISGIQVIARGTYNGRDTVTGTITITEATLQSIGSHQDEIIALINRLVDAKIAASEARRTLPSDFAGYVRGMPGTVFRQASAADNSRLDIVYSQTEGADGNITYVVEGDNIAVHWRRGTPTGPIIPPVSSENIGQGRYRYTSRPTEDIFLPFITDIPSNWSIRDAVTTDVQGTQRSISGTLSQLENDVQTIQNEPPPPIAVQEFDRSLSLQHLDTTTITDWAVSTAGAGLVRLATSGAWREDSIVHNIIPNSIITVHSNVNADENQHLHNALFTSTPGNNNKVLTAFEVDIPRLSSIAGNDPVSIFAVKQQGRDTFQTLLGAFRAGVVFPTQSTAGATESITRDEVLQDTTVSGGVFRGDDTTEVVRTWVLPTGTSSFTARFSLEENGTVWGAEQTITIPDNVAIAANTRRTLTFTHNGLSYQAVVLLTYVPATRRLTIAAGGQTNLPHRALGNTSIDVIEFKVTRSVTEMIAHPSRLIHRPVNPTQGGSSIGQGTGGSYFVVLYTNELASGNIEMRMATKEISTGNVRQYAVQDLGYDINSLDFSSIKVGNSIYELSDYDHFSYTGSTAPTVAELGTYATAQADYLGLLTPGSTRHSSSDVVQTDKDINVQGKLYIQGVEVSTTPGGGTQGESVQLQYSAVGGTTDSDWHDTLDPNNDEYIRFRIGSSGSWSAGVKFVGDKGDKGDDGRSLFIQFSPDTTIANFHDPPDLETDNYIRIRVGTPGSYSRPIRLRGEKGDTGDSVVIEYSTDGMNTTGDSGSLWHTTLTANDKYIRFTVGTGTPSIGLKFIGDDGTGGGGTGDQISSGNRSLGFDSTSGEIEWETTDTNVAEADRTKTIIDGEGNIEPSNIIIGGNSRVPEKDISTTTLQLANSNIAPGGILWYKGSVLISDAINISVSGFRRNATNTAWIRDSSNDLSTTLFQTSNSNQRPRGMAWDGTHLFIASTSSIATFTRNSTDTAWIRDTSKDVSRDFLQESIFVSISISDITWDGSSLLISDSAIDGVWGIKRNDADTAWIADTSKNISTASLRSIDTSINPAGIAWNGQLLFISDSHNDVIRVFKRNDTDTAWVREASRDVSTDLLRTIHSNIDTRTITWDGSSLLLADEVNKSVNAINVEPENRLPAELKRIENEIPSQESFAPTFPDIPVQANNVYVLTGNMFFVSMAGNSNNTVTHIIAKSDIPAATDTPSSRPYLIRINTSNVVSLNISRSNVVTDGFIITPTVGTILGVRQL